MTTQTPDAVREAAARIIDPEAMKTLEELRAGWDEWAASELRCNGGKKTAAMAPDHMDRMARSEFDDLTPKRKLALAKADAILSINAQARIALDGDWTATLSIVHEDFTQKLLETFDLIKLDTLDRDHVRHAIYYALLFPVAAAPAPAVDAVPAGEDRLHECATLLVNVLAADPGPKATAAFAAARKWWEEYDASISHGEGRK